MDETPTTKSIEILCLEDGTVDRELMEGTLVQDGLNCRVVQVQTRPDFEARLNEQKFDLIISDYSLPTYNGKEALSAARKIQPETPFILLSGTIGEELSVEFLKSGATDCVLKQNLDRLAPAVRRALAEAAEKSKRQKAEELLQAQATQLRALAARIQASREEERIRIARELHDQMGESLMTQKFGLTWIRQKLDGDHLLAPKEEIVAKIESLCSLIDDTANHVRKLCADLRPSILDDLGLSAAIEWQANEFQNRSGIACNVVQKLDGVEVEAQRATALFRIFQEILTNVARHAEATEVFGELKVTGANLVLKVHDNGKGIDKKKIKGKKSLGLLGMRERAALFEGDVVFQGVPNDGTIVTVTIPLHGKSEVEVAPESEVD